MLLFVPFFSRIGEDYEAIPRTLQFDRQDFRVCTDISIVNDGIDEPPEEFVLSLELPNITRLVSGTTNETVVTIRDILGKYHQENCCKKYRVDDKQSVNSVYLGYSDGRFTSVVVIS